MYALDVRFGSHDKKLGDEMLRNCLIEFLGAFRKELSLSGFRRGMWDDGKILRVLTSNPKRVAEFITENKDFEMYFNDLQFTIFDTEIEARRYPYFLLDLDTELPIEGSF